MRLIFGSALALCLAACVGGPPLEAGTTSQIRSGVSNKADVEQLLGAPTRRELTAEGHEMWEYQKIGLGYLYGGAKMETALIYFDGDTVSRCLINKTKGGFMNFRHTRTQNDCGDS